MTDSMVSNAMIRECALASGLRAVIHDETRHYYGGYYHVRLRITVDVPLCATWFESAAEHAAAVGRLGASACFSRMLEKMAVPEGEVALVRQSLLDSFDANVLCYLSRADFPRSFVLSEYAKALTSPSCFRRERA